MEKKICIRCKQNLPLKAFNRNINRPDGRDNICRECRHKYYTKRKGSARRYFPSEITDAELLTECKRRGLLPKDESSEADAELAEKLSAEFLHFLMWKACAEKGISPLEFFSKT